MLTSATRATAAAGMARAPAEERVGNPLYGAVLQTELPQCLQA